jgi:hypothetical protein
VPRFEPEVPSVIVNPFRLITPADRESVLVTVTLFEVILIAGTEEVLLLNVKFAKVFAVLPVIVCADDPANVTPPDAVVLSVKVPLFVKSPYTLSVPPLLTVTDAPLLIVRLLVKAAVPDAITGINKPDPDGKALIVTSEELVGTLPVHQFVEVPQSFVVPFQPEPDKTVTFTAADLLVQLLAVIATLNQVVWVRLPGV